MKEIKKLFARQLRKGQTLTEAKVWELLRERRLFGLKFRRQHVIEGFVVDFYCSEKRLVIELDGGVHKNQKDYDELRRAEIEAKGVKIVRVNNEDVADNMVALINKVKEVISTA